MIDPTIQTKLKSTVGFSNPTQPQTLLVDNIFYSFIFLNWYMQMYFQIVSIWIGKSIQMWD